MRQGVECGLGQTARETFLLHERPVVRDLASALVVRPAELACHQRRDVVGGRGRSIAREEAGAGAS